MWQESFFSAFICVVLTSEFWGNVSSKFLDAARRLPIEDYWYRVYTYMYIYSWFTYTSTFEVDDLQCPSSVTRWWMLVWPRGLLKQQRGTERPEELQPQQSLKQKPRCRTCPGRPWRRSFSWPQGDEANHPTGKESCWPGLGIWLSDGNCTLRSSRIKLTHPLK